MKEALEKILEIAEKKPATGFNCFQIANIAREALEKLKQNKQKPEDRE